MSEKKSFGSSFNDKINQVCNSWALRWIVSNPIITSLIITVIAIIIIFIIFSKDFKNSKLNKKIKCGFWIFIATTLLLTLQYYTLSKQIKQCSEKTVINSAIDAINNNVGNEVPFKPNDSFIGRFEIPAKQNNEINISNAMESKPDLPIKPIKNPLAQF